MKTVFTYGGANQYNKAVPAIITMKQSEDKKGLFTVFYGLQITKDLTYSLACKYLGQAILHHLACESIINNEGL